MMFFHAKQVGLWMFLITGLGFTANFAQADTRTTENYIAIDMEAEDFVEKDERWVLTDPGTENLAVEDDPDANHSAQAVGNTYLELLPDKRVTHADAYNPPPAIWDTPGTGPRASYNVTFPEAGRYYVHVRALSTGTEDNGLHVGLNGEFPLTGARIQLCGEKGVWGWSGRQRDSGGAGSCGVEKTIWITVPSAGEHEFTISGREDGFELDRFMLIKDNSDNTRICLPGGENEINCAEGRVENGDEITDMAVQIESTLQGGTQEEIGGAANGEMDIEETLAFSVEVRNIDLYDIASDVLLTVDMDSGWELQQYPESCNRQVEQVICDLQMLGPTGSEEGKRFNFVVAPLLNGDLNIAATVTTQSTDGNKDNDTASLAVRVIDPTKLSRLSAKLTQTNSPWTVDVESDVQFTFNNAGPVAAQAFSAVLNLPSGLVITRLPEGCIASGSLKCSYAELAVDKVKTISVGITAAKQGYYSLNLELSATNQDNASRNEASDTEIVTVENAGSGTLSESKTLKEGETSSGSGSVSLWFFSLLLLSGLFVLMRSRRMPYQVLKAAKQ